MLKDVELGNNALEYIKEELTEGDLFSKLLLHILEFERGSIRTYLPEDVKIEDLNGFRNALPSVIYSKSRKKFADFILAYLSQNKDNLIIFEANGSPNSPYLKKTKPQYFSNQQNVYLYLTSSDLDEQKVSTAVNQARDYPGIGALTSFPESEVIHSQQSISDDLLQKLAARTEHIIIDAFDQNGLLIWSKKGV